MVIDKGCQETGQAVRIQGIGIVINIKGIKYKPGLIPEGNNP